MIMEKSTLRGMTNKDLIRMSTINLRKMDKDELAGVHQMVGELNRREKRRKQRLG